MTHPTVPVPGANLPRREWCIVNHFRSGAGRCAASLHQTTHCASVEPPCHRWQLPSIQVQTWSSFPPHSIWFRGGVAAPQLHTLTTIVSAIILHRAVYSRWRGVDRGKGNVSRSRQSSVHAGSEEVYDASSRWQSWGQTERYQTRYSRRPWNDCHQVTRSVVLSW